MGFRESVILSSSPGWTEVTDDLPDYGDLLAVHARAP